MDAGTGALRAQLGEWIQVLHDNGFAAAQAAHWMDGKSHSAPRPWWNLLDALAGDE